MKTTTAAPTFSWDGEASTYDAERRRLVPCFDAFYGTAAELVARTARANPRVLDLGAGTGLLSAQVLARVKPRALTLFDASAEMLAKARARLAEFAPAVVVADFNAPLPRGEFDVIMSALAIHHLADADKRSLFARIHAALAPGGLFVNAEQILAPDVWGIELNERVHLDAARSLGSSEAEVGASVARMKFDRCATVADQVAWLREAGFARAGTFFHWFRFAVYAGWKAPLAG